MEHSSQLQKQTSEQPDFQEWEQEIQLESQNSYPSYNYDTYEEDSVMHKRVFLQPKNDA